MGIFKWLKKRRNHVSVNMGVKMIVISEAYTTSLEMFDNFTIKLTNSILEIKVSNLERQYFKAVNIGYDIVVFQNFEEPLTETVVYFYDVNQWSSRSTQ